MDSAEAIVIADPKATDRFARFGAIKWWKQSLLAEARVLVVGAGALGNEAIKNLALLGVGNLVIVDMDRIEESNLSRSILFSISDEGKLKSEVAAASAKRVYPGINAIGRSGNILSDLGLGYFRWAQVVVGALDNREAPVFVNQACAQVGRPWIDGGIDILNGIVRGFSPPKAACYECTMGQADWDLLAKRRSCSLLARKAMVEGGTATTPTTASVVGAIQAQEVVKHIHGLETLNGRGFVFEGLTHHSFTVDYPIAPDCPWHGDAIPIEEDSSFGSDVPMRQVWDGMAARFGGLDAIDLSRELVEALSCPACGTERAMHKPIDSVPADEAVCAKCRGECVPRFVHSMGENSPLLKLTPRELGIPAWDIVWARRGEQAIGIEMTADRASCLVTGPLAP